MLTHQSVALLSFFLIARIDGLSEKLTGASQVQIQQFPYQVSVRNTYGGRYVSTPFCGGAILDKNHVITAGSCVNPNRPHDVIVQAGTGVVGQGGETVKISRAIQNPNADIAILKLESPLQLSEKIQPISLIAKEPSEGDLGTVSGFGAEEEGGSYSKQLQAIMVPIQSREVCKRAYSILFNDSVFCAGYPEGGKDVCDGDNGNPLAIEGKLAGIVTWGYFGINCGVPNHPSVYVNIAKVTPWIEEVLEYNH